MIEEEINAELYNKFVAKYVEEKKVLEGNLMASSGRVSNLDEYVDLTLKFATELPSRWHSSDYLTKQRIQFLLFPEGITYHKKNNTCRTSRINILFAYVAYFKQVILNDKRGIPELNLGFASFANLVASPRIELGSKV